MPTVAFVDGMRIVVFYNDHEPPHFHAFLGEHTLRINILSGAAMDGDPERMGRRLGEWAGEHRAELLEAWADIRAGRAPRRIG